jgi:predicted GNAT family acetyltransferase
MEVIHHPGRSRFEIALPDGTVAFADYRLEGGRVVFPHTVVPREHEGQGLGSRLARASLDWARSDGLRVVPACSFYRTYMQRHPETRDLLDPAFAGF